MLFNKNIQSKNIEMQKIPNSNKTSHDLMNEALDHLINQNPRDLNLVQRGMKSKSYLLEEAELFLTKKSISKEQILEVKDMLSKYLWSYYYLDPLICNKDISDIKIINKDIVRIKTLGKRSTSDVKFESDDELSRFIRVVAIKNKINLSDINAIQTFTDKTTYSDFILRITIMTAYVNSVDTPYLHIRKIPKQKYSPNDLVRLKLASQEQMNYLIKNIKKGKGVLFTGKGASGKTTIMNTLLDQIDYDKSGLVIQENEELFSNCHPDLMFNKVRTARGEGKIEYTLKDLSINGLLVDLDYFVIGEIKGGEALYFLNACNTGHACMASVHGKSSIDAVDKLIDFMKYESDYSREDLLKMMKNMDIVVYMKDFKVNQISEIIDFDYTKKDLIYNTIYKNGVKISESQLD